MLKQRLFYKSFGFLLAVFATFVILSIFFSQTTLREFLDFLSGADALLIWAFLGLHLLAAVFRALRYQMVLGKIVQVSKLPSRGVLLLVTLVRNAFADFLPMRLGEGVYFFMLNRLGVRIVTCTSSFGVCLALDLLVLAFIFFLVTGAFWLFAGFQLPLSFGCGHVLVLVSVLIILSLLVYYADIAAGTLLARLEKSVLKIPRPGRMVTVVRRLLGWLREVLSDLERLRQSGHYYHLILLTVGLRACKYLGLYLLVLALAAQFNVGAVELAFPYLFFAFITAEASSSLPISGIMGFGVAQGVWVGVLSALGVELPEKLSIALGVHVISQVVAYSLGILSLFAFCLLMLRKRR